MIFPNPKKSAFKPNSLPPSAPHKPHEFFKNHVMVLVSDINMCGEPNFLLIFIPNSRFGK